MGLDLGSRRIGVAVSDELGLTAQGVRIIKSRSREEDLREILSMAAQMGVGQIVVGLPKNMNGTLGREAEKVLSWVESLRSRAKMPVTTWDERLTTVDATRVLLQADLSRKRRKEVVDKVAAVLMLQGFLDHQRKTSNEMGSSQ